MGKEYEKKKDVCICITELLCCKAEIYHNIVINLYVSKTLKNEKKNALPQDKHQSSKE